MIIPELQALPLGANRANIGGMDQARTAGQRTFLWIGSIGPLGHLPASGTATAAILGIPLYYLMHTWPTPVRVGVILAFTLASVWVHQIGDRILRTEDSRQLVWDELAGFLIAVMWLGVFSWPLAALAFVVQRGFDVLKVPPANWIERRWPGGWGVVGDDVIAGLYASGVVAILHRSAPALFSPG